jgi:hypothetical protein
MLGNLLELCTSYQGQFWIALASDVAIALAYFAIPLTMLVVLRDRRHDIPYPWLWSLFVTFIVACGLTHVAHVWSAFVGTNQLWLQAVIGAITAAASVGTAIAFSVILPEIRTLPSPWQQQRELEKLVEERTAQKDKLIMEINHRVGNQLQVLSSIGSLELNNAKEAESLAILGRLKSQMTEMGYTHHKLSAKDYLSDVDGDIEPDLVVEFPAWIRPTAFAKKNRVD